MTCRILHVIPSLQWGTAERQLGLVLDYCDPEEFQHQVCVLEDDSPGILRHRISDLRFLRAPPRWDLCRYSRLRGMVRDYRPDIVHAWRHAACRAVAISTIGMACARLSSLFPHAGDGRGRMGRAVDAMTANVFQMQILPTWSPPGARQWSRPARVAQLEYGVANGGSDETRIPTRQWLQARLSIPHDARIVGFVGAFLHENRLKDAIWAADLLKFVRDDVHLVLAGYGPNAGRLQAFRDQVQIADRVHFVTDPDRFQQVLEAVDVCWVPGESESSIGFLCEAMAHGIPVVAAATSAYRRYVTHRETGLLFPLGHRAGLARCTQELLDNRQLATTLGAAAQRQVAQEFSATRIAEGYRQLYCSMQSFIR